MSDELAGIAQRAVESALAAGAGDAEAYVQDSVGREIRVFDGEVESLTEAGERGVGVRCWIDHRAGYAYGTELSEEGLAGIGRDAVDTARIADADEFTIASDLQSMLTSITAAASEARWVPFGGSISTPALLLGEMAVAGS